MEFSHRKLPLKNLNQKERQVIVHLRWGSPLWQIGIPIAMWGNQILWQHPNPWKLLVGCNPSLAYRKAKPLKAGVRSPQTDKHSNFQHHKGFNQQVRKPRGKELLNKTKIKKTCKSWVTRKIRRWRKSRSLLKTWLFPKTYWISWGKKWPSRWRLSSKPSYQNKNRSSTWLVWCLMTLRLNLGLRNFRNSRTWQSWLRNRNRNRLRSKCRSLDRDKRENKRGKSPYRIYTWWENPWVKAGVQWRRKEIKTNNNKMNNLKTLKTTIG